MLKTDILQKCEDLGKWQRGKVKNGNVNLIGLLSDLQLCLYKQVVWLTI